MTEILEPSLADLMKEAFDLSLDCCYATIAPDGSYLDPTEKNIPDFVWTWADGLYHKYFEDTTGGRCSISRMISFDIEVFEKSVKEQIETMKDLIAKSGGPKKLSFEEMWARGYRGAWAGEKPSELLSEA